MAKKNLSKKQWLDMLGWYGVLAIIISYLLISFDAIEVGPLYHLIMLSGSICVIISSYYKRDYQPVIINLFISLIAIIALMRV